MGPLVLQIGVFRAHRHESVCLLLNIASQTKLGSVSLHVVPSVSDFITTTVSIFESLSLSTKLSRSWNGGSKDSHSPLRRFFPPSHK